MEVVLLSPLIPISALAVLMILVAAAWRARRAVERIAVSATRIEALLRRRGDTGG